MSCRVERHPPYATRPYRDFLAEAVGLSGPLRAFVRAANRHHDTLRHCGWRWVAAGIQDVAQNPMTISASGCTEWEGRSIFQELPRLPDAWKLNEKRRRPQEFPTSSLTECTPGQWLSEVASPGFHVLCHLPAEDGVTGAAGRLLAFKDGLNSSTPSHNFLIPSAVQSLVSRRPMMRVAVRSAGCHRHSTCPHPGWGSTTPQMLTVALLLVRVGCIAAGRPHFAGLDQDEAEASLGIPGTFWDSRTSHRLAVRHSRCLAAQLG